MVAKATCCGFANSVTGAMCILAFKATRAAVEVQIIHVFVEGVTHAPRKPFAHIPIIARTCFGVLTLHAVIMPTSVTFL